MSYVLLGKNITHQWVIKIMAISFVQLNYLQDVFMMANDELQPLLYGGTKDFPFPERFSYRNGARAKR